MLTKYDKECYSRQILLSDIGEAGQAKLKNAKVLVIGAGGLGCPVLQYLVGAGIGQIGIVDADVVSLSNLPRQILYGQDDIGKVKVEVAKLRLLKNNPHCKIATYNTFLTEQNAPELFVNYDLIVDCTDNFSARYLIDKMSLKYGKTWVYGSILEYKGQVAVFNGKKGQSYQVVFEEENTNEKSASAYGVLGVLPGIIGCVQANEVLKIICNLQNSLEGRLLIIDIKTYKHSVFEL